MTRIYCILLLCAITFLNCTAQSQQNLKIVGNNIWIREYPTAGDVIMKLNDGVVCEVLKRDKKETIKGVTDYWYKIKYKGEIGWVFGSQTTISQSRTAHDSTPTKEVQFNINNTLIISKVTSFRKIDIEDADMDNETSIWVFGEYTIDNKLFSLVQSYYFGADPEVYIVKGKVSIGARIESLAICSEKLFKPEKIVLNQDKIVFTIPEIEGCTLGNYKKTGDRTVTFKYTGENYTKL